MAEYDDRLSLAAYPFPEINRGDMVFATVETDPILLEEAKKRGFYMKDTPANRMFNELFNNGGRLICKGGGDRSGLPEKGYVVFESIDAERCPAA